MTVFSCMFTSVLEAQGEHPPVGHCGGEDHQAAGDAWQRQHFCSKGMGAATVLWPREHTCFNFRMNRCTKTSCRNIWVPRHVLYPNLLLWTELSVWSQCLAAFTGGKRGRVHPGNHWLAAEKLLGCRHPGLHRPRVNHQINICLNPGRRRGRREEDWADGKRAINHCISRFFDRLLLHKHSWVCGADIPPYSPGLVDVCPGCLWT